MLTKELKQIFFAVLLYASPAFAYTRPPVVPNVWVMMRLNVPCTWTAPMPSGSHLCINTGDPLIPSVILMQRTNPPPPLRNIVFRVGTKKEAEIWYRYYKRVTYRKAGIAPFSKSIWVAWMTN